MSLKGKPTQQMQKERLKEEDVKLINDDVMELLPQHDSFVELVPNVLKKMLKKGSVGEKRSSAVIVGEMSIQGNRVVVILFDKLFVMGTIGIYEGELITLAFEYATKRKLPVIAVVASGGIRVSEGTLALMQMVKMVSAVRQHSENGLLFVSIVTNPTLGGTSASFVSLADIIIAEEDAVFGFAGKRIIEETTHEELPFDFQSSYFAKKHGMVDIVEDKDRINKLISQLLMYHKR